MLSVIKALTEAQITIYNIEEVSPIEFQIWIHIRSFNKTSRLLEKKGIEDSVLHRVDYLSRIKSIRNRVVIFLCLSFLIGCSIYLPTKVLFIEILGNEVVSDIRILESIGQYGLFVGIDRAQVRSEEIKNHLLEDIPELNWVGVNTAGCLAVIQVLETDIQKQEESPEVSHIVAMSDGIIESCVVTRGRPLCKTGDAVKKGQILVSGYSDHHFLITATRSEGEVYAKTTKTVNVITTKNDKSYYGHVLKDNLQYEYIQEDNEQYNNKVVLVKASNKLNSNTDTKYVDMIAIDMYRLSGVNALAQLEYINNVPDNIELYATVNNGQASSNYDPDITTRMLNSESNREEVIQTILNNVRQLDGVCIDFSGLKVADKENFTQFIKELAAVLHAKNKKIIVNIPSVQYIDVEDVSLSADYVVLQPYTARTISSKTSGPISSITYVQNVIQSMLEQDINMQKVVLEIPA